MEKIDVLSEKVRKKIEKEFPNDFALQQVHFARAIIRKKTQEMSPEEKVRYYNDTFSLKEQTKANSDVV